MIPLKLVLKNFLSYRDATLDFRGLHTACICGANGAGKSSLLEAIAWAVWGQSRAASEDDVIHIGAQEAQVDFIFSNNQHTYRILRSRYRGQSSSLEFQVARSRDENGGMRDETTEPTSFILHPSSFSFRTLTAKGVRATQQLILEHLKLDYETFVNSAYLRQGRADEFMLKRPTERKQILADLLKLEQYDRVADQAKDQSRQFKGQIELLERSLEAMQSQLQTRDRVAAEQAALESTLARLRQQQMADSEQLQALQTTQQQRQTWQQQHTWQQQQQRHLEQDCQRLQQELTAIQQQQRELGALLEQEAAIVAGYRQFQTLQAQEESVSARFKAHQQAQAQRQQYQQQQNERLAEHQRQIQQVQAQLEAIAQQDAELQQTLAKATDIAAAVQQLQQARTHLSQLDQRQVQASPLLQRRQVIQSQLDRLSTRLATRLEELHASAQQLQAQQSCHPQLKQAVQEVSDRIAALDARRAYQERVREKGLERRSFMEQLQEQQRHCEGQLAALEQKMQLLAEERGEERGEGGQKAKGKRQKAKGKRLEHEFAQAAEPSNVVAELKTQNFPTSPLTPYPSLPYPLSSVRSSP
ncbi:MAG: AAA family ATPase [Stenomitos frigidus ULC029]